MITIITNEWKMWFRNKAFLFTSILFILFLIATNYLSILQFNKQKEDQKLAHQHVRSQWENIKEMNPHGAAHYGSYLFKPILPLNSFDDGISSVVGNVIRVEGHAQNELTFSEASQSIVISKFGKLKPALLLQFFLPLMLIFFTFSAITSEREKGRIKLIVLQGVSYTKLLYSKGLSLWLYSILLLGITLVIQTLFTTVINSDVITRLLLLFISYASFYYIIILLTVYFSAVLKYNSSALTVSIAIWMLWVVFFPKIINSYSEKVYPLPTRKEFSENMQKDRDKGINGHNPTKEREDEFKKEVLKKYSVDSISQLPINYDGLLMQADEEYGNKVWDKHFQKNYTSFKKQKQLYQLSGFVNPFASMQNISMASSSNDIYHHLHFLENVEKYRRILIKSLNDKMAYGGSKTGDWDWKIGNEFYKSVEDFNYHSQNLKSSIKNYFIDCICLLFWSCLVSLLVFFSKPKYI
jgi:ABC-2 type transport system permease protein